MSNPSRLSIQDIHQRYPWGNKRLAMGTPLEWLWHFDVDADRASLWSSIIDTTRLNRAMGVSRMYFEERDGVLHGKTSNLGMAQQWVEVPWDWVSGEYLISIRNYSKGFAHVVRGIYILEDLPDGRTRVYIYFGWIPRNILGASLLRLGVPQLQKEFRRVLNELAKNANQALPSVFQVQPAPISAEAEKRADLIRLKLVALEFDATIVDRLVELALRGDDLDSYRIQVHGLAHAWDVEEAQLLRMFLHATRLGLLDLSWDVICPHCRGVQTEAGNLDKLPNAGRCDVCEIDFQTDREESIEITFHIHPSIRSVEKLFYCSAEPSTKVHILLQQSLEAGEERVIVTGIVPGRYRFRLRGTKEYSSLVILDSGESEYIWSSDDESSSVSLGESPTFRLKNTSDIKQTFVIEIEKWADTALRPAHLFALQEFRDLFSEEYLATDVSLTVGSQAVLFTDMVGSTRFYAEHGDPQAFMVVKQHFTKVFRIIASNRGAVVKTIGDAVMAVFCDPLDSVRASKEIQDLFHAESESPIRLRISLHAGPCIAVNLNTAIDYFGNSINLAAKLQACVESGQIAMSETITSSPGVLDYLEEMDATLDTMSFGSQTADGNISVIRWSTF